MHGIWIQGHRMLVSDENTELWRPPNVVSVSTTSWHCLLWPFSLLEKGRQILMKDNLIDEEKAKQEEAAQETIEQKIDRLGKFWAYIFWLGIVGFW